MSNLTWLLEKWRTTDPVANATYESIQRGLPEEDAAVVLVQALLSERQRMLNELADQLGFAPQRMCLDINEEEES
jgi:hypothetical protein